jgi:hypothetical protein
VCLGSRQRLTEPIAKKFLDGGEVAQVDLHVA